jgi:hypothetical protein
MPRNVTLTLTPAQASALRDALHVYSDIAYESSLSSVRRDNRTLDRVREQLRGDFYTPQPPKDVVDAFNSLSDQLDPSYKSHGIRTDARLRVLQDYIDPLPATDAS